MEDSKNINTKLPTPNELTIITKNYELEKNKQALYVDLFQKNKIVILISIVLILGLLLLLYYDMNMSDIKLHNKLNVKQSLVISDGVKSNELKSNELKTNELKTNERKELHKEIFVAEDEDMKKENTHTEQEIIKIIKMSKQHKNNQQLLNKPNLLALKTNEYLNLKCGDEMQNENLSKVHNVFIPRNIINKVKTINQKNKNDLDEINQSSLSAI